MNKIYASQEAVHHALIQAGIPDTAKNRAALVHKAPNLDGVNSYVGAVELSAGAAKLASGMAASKMQKPTKSLAHAVAHPPKGLRQYEISLSPAGTELTFDPSRSFSPVGLRSATRGVDVSRTERGGAKISITDASNTALIMEKGRWTQTTLARVVQNPKDLERLEERGYNISALRPVLSVQTEDGGSTFFALRQTGGADAPDPQGASYNGDDPSRGLIAICSEVTIVDFDRSGPIFTVRKPVIYLYPEETTRVAVRVSPTGSFIAQYPEVQNGTWEVVAHTDGTLFDTRSERRFGYLFWEAQSAAHLALDAKRAHLVKSADVETFLEKTLARFGFNDRERTDFISYWIAPLRKNPVSMVQFLVGDECNAYASMSINPRPDTLIRVYVLFQRALANAQVGSPALPEFKRQRFTAVEWGGVNLDERG